MSGNEVRKAWAEKKVSLTSGQPVLVKIRAASPPMTTTDESAAIAWPRRDLALRARSRAARRAPLSATADPAGDVAIGSV
jgi:hypothetical protein